MASQFLDLLRTAEQLQLGCEMPEPLRSLLDLGDSKLVELDKVVRTAHSRGLLSSEKMKSLHDRIEQWNTQPFGVKMCVCVLALRMLLRESTASHQAVGALSSVRQAREWAPNSLFEEP